MGQKSATGEFILVIYSLTGRLRQACRHESGLGVDLMRPGTQLGVQSWRPWASWRG